MDYLGKEILRYKKKNYEVEQRRTLKYGSRAFLKKKGGFWGTDSCVYIYYVEGDATTDSYSEFLKDYVKFFQNNDFDSSDKGLFLCSGNCDQKLFRDLKKAMIENDHVRNSIKLMSLREATEKKVEERQPRREVEEANAESSEILSRIKKFTIHKKPKTEKDLDSMLVHYLSAFYPDIQTQVSYQNARIDAQVGKVGIEIKYQPSAGEFDRLYGQTEKYLKSLEKVIVVIGYERTRELTESFEKRVKERGWLDSKVFVLSLR
jgi:hypothetical protein